MNPFWYGRIANLCMFVAVASALLFDRISGVYQTLIGVAGVLAAIVLVVTYFWGHYLVRKKDENS